MKKLLKILLCIVFIFPLSSSNKIQKTYKFNDYLITFDNIFNFNKEDYYVFFYLKFCLSCKYLIEKFQKDECYLRFNIYYVDLETLPLSNLSGQNNNLEVSKYQNIYINSAPTILEIYKKKVIKQLDNMSMIMEEFDL